MVFQKPIHNTINVIETLEKQHQPTTPLCCRLLLLQLSSKKSNHKLYIKTIENFKQNAIAHFPMQTQNASVMIIKIWRKIHPGIFLLQPALLLNINGIFTNSLIEAKQIEAFPH